MKHEDHQHIHPYYEECDDCQHKATKARAFFKELGVPIIRGTVQTGALTVDVKVRGILLYDILMDEEKLKTLVSKIRLKAFW